MQHEMHVLAPCSFSGQEHGSETLTASSRRAKDTASIIHGIWKKEAPRICPGSGHVEGDSREQEPSSSLQESFGQRRLLLMEHEGI